MKRSGQYQHIATIWILLFCLSLTATGCSDEEPVETQPGEPAVAAPPQEVRTWYPAPRHTQQQQPQMIPMQQPLTTQPGTVYQPLPVQQQPQVIIVQPAYQPQYAQPMQQPAYPQQVYPQQSVPQQQYLPQQQYVPEYQTQFQYGQRPWGETGSYGQSRTAQPAGGGRQQTFGVPYGSVVPPTGGTYPGWGVSPQGTFPGNPYPGSVW